MARLAPDVAAIHLGRMSPPASCNPPGRLIRKPIAGPCEPARRPYSVLLPMGFTVPSALLQTRWALTPPFHPYPVIPRSEEHTSELQSRENLVCRLLLEKKK